ncbi:hypothetical protein [Streptomyces acidiscabies]|uniref:Uncharacterized protein n=1 Tax=Streptomyces acidiscabies TaxID=42234 RepID=A0AAP6BK08_9ACTN|nr:hypothetical protein [Streptomyces acidiscabies]MBP5937293.1 hypothetical protein [Streptomyces sp. LBUM 1476]MBZ3914643.1 hypothetical protein [Streptomyces acidiscabies]MDX2966194.1 hypothetical protein [Streptomyces acidiscabies]MDX3025537.1 hypothetical protein [Streptomyces acidiscabies]MDX3796186.1 hypothetical protein [Streptomyces acidiscabies]
MSPSTSALIVAVVGVAGTLLSGVLAHRGALRSTSMELEHARVEREAEREAVERRENVEARRASYVQLNRAIRELHLLLWQHREALATRAGDPAAQTAERADAQRELREAYATAQLVVTDDVLQAAGRLVHQLQRIHTQLARHEQNSPGNQAPESLDELLDRLKNASESLYEVRQHMRRDLGITNLPIERPEDHGAR